MSNSFQLHTHTHIICIANILYDWTKWFFSHIFSYTKQYCKWSCKLNEKHERQDDDIFEKKINVWYTEAKVICFSWLR